VAVDVVIKNINRVIQYAGVLVLVSFLSVTLTPISNYTGAHFAVRPHIQPAGAIVVLGGGVLRGGMLNDASLRRTISGIELYKANLAPFIIFSGPTRDVPANSEAALRKRVAVNVGVPENAIIKEERAHTTEEESTYISQALQGRNIKTILLVTESLHMRRATYLFERAGMEVYPAPSDNLSIAATSSGDRLTLTIRIAEEASALIYYRLIGYI
jgi:uncharacterized SAM-binding protein YcdF (DUF218 family)